MTLIDNGWSINMILGGEGDWMRLYMNNIKIYGETEARDCFYENQCNYF